MSDDMRRTPIVLIDRQHSWLERSAQALRAAGFEVESLEHYNYPPATPHSDRPVPKLVVLGCASIGPDEQELIGRILEHKDHLLVLSTSLPWRVMRELFLNGAADVTEKPYDSSGLITTVNQVLGSLSPNRS
jgi:DNA-binding NtrC family response regulator